MTSPSPQPITRFVLAVHAHQPVGNFEWVMEEAYTAAYKPFFDALEKHPKVPVCVHYSGGLLDWLKAKYPEFLRRLKGMVERGQVEVMGGGYYEPVLPIIPRRDALGQLKLMRNRLHQLGLNGGATGASRKRAPKGARGIDGVTGGWLAERVWEPQIPSIFVEAGLRYTVIDDAHLAGAGVPEDQRFGYYITEDCGRAIALFPSSKRMRYMIPFKPVHEVIRSLWELKSVSPRVVVLADDGEKFGFWPGTHTWVYKEGWLESFLTELETNAEWLRLTTFRQCLEEVPPLGRLYLPSGSYEEMLTWSGGFFRNFFAKYPEADTMHKKMLWISGRLSALEARLSGKKSAARSLSAVRERLYKAQGNDAYWHGVFGGLYLQHLRRNVYEHLLRAERELDALEWGKKDWVQADVLDFDADQADEVLLRSRSLTGVVDLQRGGTLLELSDKESGINLLDTLTRRPEPYHEHLRSGAERHTVAAGGNAGGPSTIHERRAAPVELLESLVYDRYRRAGLVDHALAPDASLEQFAKGEALESGDFLEGTYEAAVERSAGTVRAVLSRRGALFLGGAAHPIQMVKEIGFSRKGRAVSVSYRFSNPGGSRREFLFGSEMNLGLKDAHVNRPGEARGIERFCVLDPAVRLKISWILERDARLWYFPLETVSDSERGMERTYQGVNITFLWPVRLVPRGSWAVSWTMRVEPPDGR